jgi:hypothetical protein
MRVWITAGVLFFVYVAAVSLVLPWLPARQRWLAIAGGLAGLLLCRAADAIPHHRVLHEWVLPPAILLLAYWIGGLLFVAPMPRVERALESIDRNLRIDRLSAALPRWLAEMLEVAYVGVYPTIPIALAIHLLSDPAPDPDRFWTVILITDFICFGCLPWVQTRPPRAGRIGDPWISTVRRLNLTLLGRTSIQVNTFPSGHAAEALAAALLVANAPWPVAAAMFVNAGLISAGTVLGRYHYAADVLAGWAVAAGVRAAVFALGA